MTLWLVTKVSGFAAASIVEEQISWAVESDLLSSNPGCQLLDGI